MPKSLCGICLKSINNIQRAIQCDSCESSIHLKCNELSRSDYDYLKQCSDTWFCINCISKNLPFSTNAPLPNNLINSQYKELFTHLNQRLESIQEIEVDDDNNGFNIPLKCQYMDITEFNDTFSPKEVNFSLFHLNVASLTLNFENLNASLQTLNLDFDVIGISETRIRKETGSSSNLNITNYTFEGTPTESSAGGTGLYISNNLVYKRRNDLEIYKSNQLESTFIEIINIGRPNIIVSCIYRHPCMSLNEFNEDFLHPLLLKLSPEHNKKIFLMGDFNVDLLKADKHPDSSTFLDLFESYNLMPKIIFPTRVTSRSRTLIDNIFTNLLDQATISGNLDLSISDHLPQFLVTPIYNNAVPKKHNIMIRDMKRFNKENFVNDIQNINWDELLAFEQNIDHSFDSFLNKVNEILDKHAPLKRANKKELKIQQKPWITGGILCSIKKRDIIFRQFRKCQSPNRKNALNNKYKLYRNQIVSLIKTSKRIHMQNFFNATLKNTRKVWQGIRDIINVKNRSNFSPSHIVLNGISYTDPKSIANRFNEFFSTIGNKTQDKVYSNHVDFHSYLTNPSADSIFLTPTSPIEVQNIFNSFKNNKSLGPNSIPNNILHLVCNDISAPISKLINLSYENGSFPSTMKLAKVIPVHKKGSQVDLDNYRPISLLSNINKVFEKIMYSRVYDFLSSQNIFF